MTDNFCIKTSAIWQFVGYGINVIKILIPIIIIILGMIDFSKASIAGDDKAISGAAKSLGIRVVMGMAIFFVPTIVSIVLGLVSEASGVKEKISGCETCLLRATSEDCQDIVDEAKALRSN